MPWPLAVDRRLVFHPAISDGIEQRFRQLMNRAMPEINKRQAFVIEGAEVLPNDRGTGARACGSISIATARIMLLPGPPHELKSMFLKQCLARHGAARAQAGHRDSGAAAWRGWARAIWIRLIAPVYTKYTNPVTTVLAHNGDIQVHLRARCATTAEALALLAEVGGTDRARCWATGSTRATAIRSK